MTLFKYFFHVLKSYKAMIILYTAMLIIFGTFSLQMNSQNTDFSASKPDVIVVSHDQDTIATKHLISYIKQNAVIKENISDRAIDDALFYRDINYVVEIPSGYTKQLEQGQMVNLKVKSTGDYNASYMEMLLTRYQNVLETYQKVEPNLKSSLKKVDWAFQTKTVVKIDSKLDVGSLSKAAYFYNFANYSLLAGCVFVIAMTLTSFQSEKIKKRMLVGGKKDTSINRTLFLGNAVFALALWLLYVIISFILTPKAMMSISGLLFALNSFVFMICALSIGFFIGSFRMDRNAIGGVVNVIALGSCFLCGAFVPIEFLPKGVLAFARCLPSYWYIQNNEFIKTLDTFHGSDLQPFFLSLLIVALFALGIFVLNQILSHRRRVLS